LRIFFLDAVVFEPIIHPENRHFCFEKSGVRVKERDFDAGSSALRVEKSAISVENRASWNAHFLYAEWSLLLFRM
jgi:hypothetical protein